MSALLRVSVAWEPPAPCSRDGAVLGRELGTSKEEKCTHLSKQRVLACNTAEQRGEGKEEEGKGRSPEMLTHRGWDVRGCSHMYLA